ncbi:tyrosine-protein phosphatase [Pseudomonas brenneri]
MADQKDLILQGADNFRSLKGMPTRCGRRIGGHSLLRADQLHRLTADYAVIEAEYGGLGRYLQGFSGLSHARLQQWRDTLLGS